MTKCSPNLKTLEDKWNNTPAYLTEGKLWQLFDNIYDSNKRAFAEHIIKITCWEKWAVDICNKRLKGGEKVAKLIDLNNKNNRWTIVQASNDNFPQEMRKKWVL